MKIEVVSLLCNIKKIDQGCDEDIYSNGVMLEEASHWF